MLHSYKMQFNVEVFRIQYSDRALLRNTLQITVLGLYSVTVYILKVSFPTLVFTADASADKASNQVRVRCASYVINKTEATKAQTKPTPLDNSY